MLGRRVFIREVAALYEAFSTGKPLPSELPINMRICRVAAAVAARGARYSAELLEAATKRR